MRTATALTLARVASGRPVPAGSPPGPRIVALGGGHGLSALLSGLKHAVFPRSTGPLSSEERERLTAVVTVADDGGSSGVLRRDYGVIPPGDLRNCLTALADADPVITSLFDFRFDGDSGLGGHSLGNLILTALSQMEHNLMKALAWAEEFLSARGHVLPASLDRLSLRARHKDGSWSVGESRIAACRRGVESVHLSPRRARALPQAIQAVERADLVTIGPGSLYTSLIPVMLVPGLAAALARCRAPIVLIANLMSEPGETDGYTTSDFLLAIHRHAPGVRIDAVLANVAPIPGSVARRYAATGAAPIPCDRRSVSFLGTRVVEADLIDPWSARHHAGKLGGAVMELARKEPAWACAH